MLVIAEGRFVAIKTGSKLVNVYNFLNEND